MTILTAYYPLCTTSKNDFKWVSHTLAKLTVWYLIYKKCNNYFKEHQTYYLIWLSYSNKVAAAAKLLQSCLTLCNPTDSRPPGSSIPGFSRQEYWSGLPFPSPMHACMYAKSLQSCPNLCDPMDSSPPGSSIHRILQTRILEWGAISFFTTK